MEWGTSGTRMCEHMCSRAPSSDLRARHSPLQPGLAPTANPTRLLPALYLALLVYAGNRMFGNFLLTMTNSSKVTTPSPSLSAWLMMVSACRGVFEGGQ